MDEGGAAAVDGVGDAAEVGLVDDGCDEVFAAVRRQRAEEFGDEGDVEDSVHALDLPLHGGGEVGRQRAGVAAAAAPVFAEGACCPRRRGGVKRWF